MSEASFVTIEPRRRGQVTGKMTAHKLGAAEADPTALEGVARDLVPPSASAKYSEFGEVGAYDDQEGMWRVYGFRRGPGRPNTHELPPSTRTTPLLYGPILVTLTAPQANAGGALAVLTVDRYRDFRERIFGEEDIGSDDSDRSDDSDDSGGSLEGFISENDDFPELAETYTRRKR